MKRFVYSIFFFSCLIGIFPQPAAAQFIVRLRPVAPAYEVVRPPQPGPRHVWIEGHWRWDRRRGGYVWVEGHWIRARHGQVWVNGHWEDVPGQGSRWIPGHWRR
jgi:hypothetical protein